MFIYICDDENEYIINTSAISKISRPIGSNSFYINYKDGTQDSFWFSDTYFCNDCYCRIMETLISFMKEDNK